jgi:1-deoxy-D-xylulose-5-phosphate synthase
MKVVASLYSTFLQRAFDNLFHDVCLQELPVVFAIDRAGLAGPDGSTHNGIYDISFLNAMPNMVITQPRNGHVLKELLESSFSWGRPAAIRYPNRATEESNEPLQPRPLGKGEVLAEGEDILIIGLGHMVYTALQLKEMLNKIGVKATVLDPVFVKPLDTELLCRLLLTHQRIVTIEEHSLVSGMGSILNNFLMTQGFSNIQVVNFGIPETFVEQGSHAELMNELGLTPQKIYQRLMLQFNLKTAPTVCT